MQNFIDEKWDDEIIPALTEYIRIPNKSPAFDPDWAQHGHMREAVDLLATWTERQGVAGLDCEIVELPGRTPVLFCEIPATAADAGTVLLYGHYDKQPEFDGWRDGLGPWQPVIEDGKLYGRGGADDGYALFASLTAIQALERADVPHGRCVILIEGCEESGSFDLPAYIDHLAARIGTPELVVCLDAEAGNYDQLWITTSLRGLAAGVLEVTVLREGVHSGMAGGIVPSSFRLLRGLIERVESAISGELLPALHVEVPRDARDMATATARVLSDTVLERFPWAGSRPPGLEPADALLANTWLPSLATVGLSGAPEVGDAGNTLRPATAAKLAFRLPPTLDAQAAAAALKAELERDPPEGAVVRFEIEAAESGWSAPAVDPWLAASVQHASERSFGAPAMYMGCGGTIPFMGMLGQKYPGVQFLVTGVLGPNSNAHGPNEFLHIDTGKKVTGCVAHVLADHGARGGG